jgi:O-antigen ligase
LAVLAALGITVVVLSNPPSMLAILLILAPLRTLYSTEAPRLGLPTLPLDIGQILVIALGISWLGYCLRMRRLPTFLRCREVYALLPLLPLAVFLGAGAASIFSAFSITAALTEWLKWVQIAVIALITLDICTLVRPQTVLHIFIAAGAAHAIIGIYQYFGGSGALHLLINDRNFRAFGTFGQPNPFGGFMGIMFPLAFVSFLASLAQSLRQHQRLGRTILALALSGIAVLLTGTALIMSWSRGAWLGFGVSVAAMLIALPKKWFHSVALAAALAGIGLGITASGRLPASITERLGSITEELFNIRDVRGIDITPVNYAVVERLAHWQAALAMATDHPWLGVGIGNYESAYPQYRLMNWKFPLGHAHNMYLNTLAEIGFFGLATYAAFIFSLLWYAWRCRAHPDQSSRLIAIGVLGVWVYVVIHSLTDNLYVNNVFIHLSVTIGMLASLARDIPMGRPVKAG